MPSRLILPLTTWPPYSTRRCTPGGCHEAGSTPVLWYVNLVYFTCPVHAADELAAWTEARQQMKVTDVRVTEIQIVRWQYTVTGMMPVALASASLL